MNNVPVAPTLSVTLTASDDEPEATAAVLVTVRILPTMFAVSPGNGTVAVYVPDPPEIVIGTLEDPLAQAIATGEDGLNSIVATGAPHVGATAILSVACPTPFDTTIRAGLVVVPSASRVIVNARPESVAVTLGVRELTTNVGCWSDPSASRISPPTTC